LAYKPDPRVAKSVVDAGPFETALTVPFGTAVGGGVFRQSQPPKSVVDAGPFETALETTQQTTPATVTVGVGPWPGAWPDDPRYDPELLAHGDARNVADQYRYWTVDAIRADLAARRDPARQLHIAIENWEHDFNIGSIVRTANAFNAASVHIVGRKRWNRRGAMVTDRYLDVFHEPDVAGLLDWIEGQGTTIPLIGVDNVPGSVPMETFVFPPTCLLVFGSESAGLSPQMQAACEAIVAITQSGSTRSINAGAAAAIAIWAWRGQAHQTQ